MDGTQLLLVISWILLTLFAVGLMSLLAVRLGPGVFIGAYAGLTIMSAVLATKVISFPLFGLVVPAGVIVYSASFLVTDILCECYIDGRKHAAAAVWTGLFMMLLYWLYALVAVHWPPAAFWTLEAEFRAIIAPSWRIAWAGGFTFIISQFLDIFLFQRIKRATKGKHLWLRNNGSTCISQFVDTILFITLAFYGTFPIVPLIIGQYVVKVIIALCDTPFVYMARWVIVGKRSDNKFQAQS